MTALTREPGTARLGGEVAVPVTEPLVSVPVRTASDVLRAAARYIEEHGWCQKRADTPDGRVCLFGAIWAVEPDGEGQVRVERLMQASLGIWPPTWNDTPGRTRDEVLAALRAAAESQP